MPEYSSPSSSTRTLVYCLDRASSHKNYRYNDYLIPSENYALQVDASARTQGMKDWID